MTKQNSMVTLCLYLIGIQGMLALIVLGSPLMIFVRPAHHLSYTKLRKGSTVLHAIHFAPLVRGLVLLTSLKLFSSIDDVHINCDRVSFLISGRC